MTRLTKTKLDAITKPGLTSLGDTLYLRIAPGGSRQWVQRLTINGRRHDIGLGSCKVVTLSMARHAALKNRLAVYEGRDPLAEKRKAAVPTFREAAMSTHKAKLATWRSAKSGANWMAQLERHAFRKIGRIPVDRIERDDILRVLTPIWTDKPETARRVRRAIKTTLQWALAKGYVEQNLAGEAIEGTLPRMRAVKAHLRALPYQDVADALRTVDQARASIAARCALRFLVLTAARSGEVRGARWDEIDRDEATWIVPADRMKSHREHRVPLTPAALAVLDAAAEISDGSGLVFPSPARPGNPLSDMALTKLLRDTGLAERATIHGFRSSFRDWCAETGKPREIAEAALAHTVGNAVEAAYFRSDLLARRRSLMDQWAAYLTDESRKVVSLRG